jgi:hypothetical protein
MLRKISVVFFLFLLFLIFKYPVAAQTATPTDVPASPTATPSATITITAAPSATIAPSATPSATLTPIPTPDCSKRPRGDANCNLTIDLADFEMWRKDYTSSGPHCLALGCRDGDFNSDGKVDLVDFEIWRAGYLDLVPPTAVPPTATPTKTPTPTVATITPTVTPTPDPRVCVPIPVSELPAGIVAAAKKAVPNLVITSACGRIEKGILVYTITGHVGTRDYILRITTAKVLDVKTISDGDDDD